ncbi:hypothetical protein G6514_005550 [Epicoccum nigrum]|nr:hypothetical protein G6514_005550 [Epicoccum nigrum]
MGSVWDAGGATKPLDVMLVTMAKHRRQSLLTALSQLLFSPNTQQSPDVSNDENMWILHQISYSTCAEIARSRTNQLHKRVRRFNYPKKSVDDFALWFGRSQKKAGARADETISLFAEVQAAYPDENWPKWADPLQFDMEIHRVFLRQLAGSPRSIGSGSAPGNEGQGGSARSAKASEKAQPRPSQPGTTEELRASQEKTLLSHLSPQDPERHASLAALAQTKLAWRKVFITRHGFLGLGPSWLHRGDSVMLVRGARVPYAFTPLLTDLQRREKDVREAVDGNQKKYNKIAKELQGGRGNAYLHPIDNVVHSHGLRKLERLDEEQERLDRKLNRISATPPWEDAWVLQGEVAIESVLEQKAMDRGAWERITVI